MNQHIEIISRNLDELIDIVVDEHRTSDEHEAEIRLGFASAYTALDALAKQLEPVETIISPLPPDYWETAE